MSRESIAKAELDKAEALLLKNSKYVRELSDILKSLGDTAKVADMLGRYQHTTIYEGGIKDLVNSYKTAKANGKVSDVSEFLKNREYSEFGKKILSNSASGFNAVLKARQGDWVGVAADGVVFVVQKGLKVANPIFLAIDILNFADELSRTDPNDPNSGAFAGLFDLSNHLKNLYNKLFGDDLSHIDMDAAARGILRITMPDGTVYSRPLFENISGLITGGNGYTNDVLFGGNGNDTLMGKDGSDLLIGGKGDDTYLATKGDTIKDSDHTGSVHFNGHHLTGGKWDKDKNAYVGGILENIYYTLDKDNGTLTVKSDAGTITIENYSKDEKSLGIVLQDPDEYLVTIGNQTAIEKNQKMEFTITLDKALEKGETLVLKVNGKEVVFKEYQSSQTFIHTWSDDSLKEEDEKFEVSASVVSEKSNVKAIIKNSGQGLIKDDDRDPDDDLPETYDPLVIDLNNDGIKGTSLDYSINFDLNSDGFKEATSWIDSNDAFIAIDKNANGIIDNGSELFGDKSVSNSYYAYISPTSKNGFEALKEYDSDNNNIIDINDKEFENLLLWQDKNSDGISQENEIIKLSEKVKSINLSYTKNGQTEISSATLNDNTEVKVQDMYFSVDLKKTDEIIDENQIPFEIKSLPNVVVTGNLHSLHYAMANNETLATMVNLYLLMDSENLKEFANLNLLVA